MKLLLRQIADRFGKIPLGIEIMTTVSPNFFCRISVLLPPTSPVLIPAHMVVEFLGHMYVHVQIDHIIPNCFVCSMLSAILIRLLCFCQYCGINDVLWFKFIIS